jgi:iron complex outermembrane recepter protein
MRASALQIRSKLFNKSTLAVAIAHALTVNVAIAQEQKLMEEVLVSATKREQNLQDIPLAVTAVSGEDLVKMQITNVLSLEKVVPGLSIRSAGNNPQAIIRGAGSAGTSDTAVPFYINGMYLPHTGQALASFVDIERVEGLRGPQGTLFGRNTFGGLINIITKSPDIDDFSYGVAATAGDYDLRKFEGYVNVPIGDTMAFRLTAADETRDPFVENVVNSSAGLKDSDYTYARAQFKFAPTDTLSINLTASHWKDTANGNLSWGYKPLGVPLDRNDPTKFDQINGYLDPRAASYTGCPDGDRAGGDPTSGNICNGDAYIVDGEFTIDYDFTPQREAKETAYYLNVNWEVANHNLTLNAASFDYEYQSLNDVDFSSVESVADGEWVKSNNKQIDVTLSSLGDGPLHYTLGAYLYDSQGSDNRYAYLYASLQESWSGYAGATPETPSWAYWLTEGYGGTESKAIYAQADYDITDKLTLTAGARYTNDDRASTGSNPLDQPNWDLWPAFANEDERIFDASNPSVPKFDYSGAATEQADESHTDWRLGGQYQMNDDLMFYGYMATAYIAGSIDSTSKDLLDPQENETIELGVKATLFDNSLRLNTAVYSAEYEGFTTTVFEIFGEGGVPVAKQVSGGSIESYGLEVEGFWDVSENIVVDFNIAYDKSTYDEFNVASRTGTDNVDFIDAGGNGWYIMDGKETPFSPEWTIGAGLSYHIDLREFGALTPYIRAYYNSGYQTAREATFFTEQDAYTKIDLSLNWVSSNGDFTVAAYVNNATDEVINTSTDISPAPLFIAYADYSDPRNYGVRFGYNF